MATVHDVVIFLHWLNRWLAVAAGSWAVALACVDLLSRHSSGRLGRVSWGFFTGSVHAQAGLGLLLWAVIGISGAAPFSGRTATLIGHAFGGLLAALFAGLGLWLSRRAGSSRAQAVWAAGCGILALFMLGKLPFALGLLAASVVAAWVVHRCIRPADHPTSDAPATYE